MSFAELMRSQLVKNMDVAIATEQERRAFLFQVFKAGAEYGQRVVAEKTKKAANSHLRYGKT